MLNVSNITAGYGDFVALRDVSFHVNEGEVIAFIGSNGAGKTTIMRTICGLVKPSAGSLKLNDLDFTALEAYQITKLGIVYVPEGRRLFGKLSIYDNLLVGSYLKENRLKRKENLERIYSMFPILYERRNQKAGTLSGGEQQMLAIARGLMSCPSILMLDEPSLGIAPVIVDKVFEIIEDLKKAGLTIIINEQNAMRALAVSDRGYVVQSGRIVLSGTNKELETSDEVRRAYLGL